MVDDEFEWDDAKAAANVAKHGVSFTMARRVFEDTDAIRVRDNRRDYGEERLMIIGAAGGDVLCVVYVQKEGRVRIISARRANKHERQAYFDIED